MTLNVWTLSLALSNSEELMPLTRDESYIWCQTLAKQTARNFYFSFLTLPADQYRAMCALYAFMRITDDWSDDERLSLDQKRAGLARWRNDFLRQLTREQVGENAHMSDNSPLHQVLPAICHVVQLYRIPAEHLTAVIDGVETDLTHSGYDTFDDLKEYCRLVAGVIGLCCLPIWGCTLHEAEAPALSCGLAFQLTNILRDLGEDAERGRCYLPREDLHRFGYTPQMLAAKTYNPAFRELMAFEVDRARSHYREAERLNAWLNSGGRGVFQTMFRVYSGLLDEIERREYNVFSTRVTLPAWKKYLWVTQSLIMHRLFKR
ncbi:MAG: phytoene/squalene synthase family protein [Planctomycetota bacterium]|nr:phytoene/squalene synthase family protein [Planctomycetota bacterium]